MRTESELETLFYARGTAISFAEFIEYRDACDEARGDLAAANDALDDAQRERDAALEEVETLKRRLLEVADALDQVDVDNYSPESLKEILDEILRLAAK